MISGKNWSRRHRHRYRHRYCHYCEKYNDDGYQHIWLWMYFIGGIVKDIKNNVYFSLSPSLSLSLFIVSTDNDFGSKSSQIEQWKQLWYIIATLLTINRNDNNNSNNNINSNNNNGNLQYNFTKWVRYSGSCNDKVLLF